METNNKNIVIAWNEAEELSASLRELTDDELIECRNSLLKRAEKIMNKLDSYLTDMDL